MTGSDSEFEREQEDAAAAEAGSIGGRVSADGPTEAEREMGEAERPVSEGGGGESEGFELAEVELEEHAAHGDEHSAGRVLEDAAGFDDAGASRDPSQDPASAGEADAETTPDG